MAKKYFVTRHRGAITWAAQGGTKARKVEMENFDASALQPGDVVMGTLPVHIAAEVNKRGAHYWHLTMDIPVEFRGKELTAVQMREFGARLEEFRVQGFGQRVSQATEHSDEQAPATVHLCIATGQPLANVLPLVALDQWERVVIFASEDMQAQTGRLVELIEVLCEKRGLVGTRYEVVKMPRKLDWASLRTFAAQQAQRLATEAGLDFNITGGNKLMTLAFNAAFGSRVRQLYCSTQDESLDIIDTVAQGSIPLAPGLLDLDLYLAAQGYKRAESTEMIDMMELIRRAPLTVSLALAAAQLERVAFAGVAEVGASRDFLRPVPGKIKSLLGLLHSVGCESCEVTRKPNQRPFNPWVQLRSASTDEVSIGLLESMQKYGVIRELQVTPSRTTDKASIHFKFADNDAARYISGGYLEEYVLLCMNNLGLPQTHFAGNVQIGVTSKINARVSNELNELDAVAVWRNRLLVIECKAGSQLRLGKDQDIMNRLDQLKDNVGGAMGKAWLVSSRKLDNPDVMQRASLNGLRVIHEPEEIRSLAEQFAHELQREVNSAWKPEQLVLSFLQISGSKKSGPKSGANRSKK